MRLDEIVDSPQRLCKGQRGVAGPRETRVGHWDQHALTSAPNLINLELALQYCNLFLEPRPCLTLLRVDCRRNRSCPQVPAHPELYINTIQPESNLVVLEGFSL